MAQYLVRMTSKNKVHKETSPTLHEPVFIIGFEILAEGYANTVEIPEKDFNMAKAKKAIKEKLIEYEENSFTPVEFEVNTS